MANLTREQQQVLSALLAEGRKIKDPRTRRVYERAAVQTGLVESNLRELSGGDADSQNWRQERESGYGAQWAKTGGANNTAASAARFRQEFLQHYTPGEKSYDVAAQVQRPREDLRGRYHEEAGAAAAILRQYGGGGGGGAVDPQAAGSSAPAGQAAPQFDLGQGTDASALIALLGRREQPRVQSSTPLATPAATAGPAMPAGFRALSSGGGPAPKGPDVSELLSLVRTQGGGAAPAPAQADGAAASPGAPAAPLPASAPKGRVFPTGGVGKVIGTPYAGTHTLGNWQSDNAIDIAAPVGTPMLALQAGTVVKVTKHPQGSGRFAGDQITIRGANGNEYFYAHGLAEVKAGQKIKRGQSLGTTGSANGVAHLHFGQMKGDPRKHTK